MSRKTIGLLIIALFFGLAFADGMGFFDDQSYTEVSIGGHVHYVPKDRDADIDIHDFPTTPPGPNEYITPLGRIAPR